MNCQKCHQPLPAGAKNCPGCGTTVLQESEAVRYFTSPRIMATISVFSIIFCIAVAVVTGVMYAQRSYWMSSETELMLQVVTIVAPLGALLDAFQMFMRGKVSIRADEKGISGTWPGTVMGSTILSVEPFQYAYREIEAVEGKNSRLRICVGGKWKTMLLDSPEDLQAIIERRKNA